MKATKNFMFSKRIVAFICAMVLLCALPTFTAMLSVSADETLPVMNLEEFDRWDADGWKIEKKPGVYEDDGGSHPYDYVMTVAEHVWTVNITGAMRIGNVASRAIEFNLTTSTGIVVSGNPSITSSSWYVRSSTDSSIAALTTQNNNGRYLMLDSLKGKVGQAVLTLTMNRTLNEEPVKGTLRILYNCVSRETEKFTFTGLEKDRNNNKNSVWLNGINIPAANEEWTKAEEVGGLSVAEFYDNIFFLEGNEDGTPAGVDKVEFGVNDLRTIMRENKSPGDLKFQTEVRSNHIELKKQSRTMEGPSAEENGSPIDFEEGDAFFFKKGLYLMGKDGNGNWAKHETGFVFTELLRDQYFVYLGEELGWSADQLGMSIAFANTNASVDAGDTITLTPNISGGEALSPEQKIITWTSADESIATVDQTGKVTGVKKGSTTITATTGTGDFAVVDLEVVATDEITSIRLNAANINLNIGGTRQIAATVEGGTTADKSVTWTTSDATVATVSETGLVTAVGAGTCTITATASDGQSASANITVRQGSIEPDPSEEPEPSETTTTDPAEKPKSGCGSTVVGSIVAIGAMIGVVALFVVRRKSGAKS